MPTNRSKPETWDADTNRSVMFYNNWCLRFAPEAYRKQRFSAAETVEGMLAGTNYLLSVTPEQRRKSPAILSALRMSTAPPIARDRLVGLAAWWGWPAGDFEEFGL